MAQQLPPSAADDSAQESGKKPLKRRSGAGAEIDLDLIKEVLEMMESHHLSEFEVQGEGLSLRLRKGYADESLRVAPVYAHPGAAAPAPAPAAPAQPAEDAALAGTKPIKSPMVGTFYRAPAPDAEPFAKVGDRVDDESVVCIIEAMKVMNEIKAEVTGEIVKLLVENGATVEYGQPLMLVRTA